MFLIFAKLAFLAIFLQKNWDCRVSPLFDYGFQKLWKGEHCVDLGESFPTSIFLMKLASIQPRTSPLKCGRKFNSIFIRLHRHEEGEGQVAAQLFVKFWANSPLVVFSFPFLSTSSFPSFIRSKNSKNINLNFRSNGMTRCWGWPTKERKVLQVASAFRHFMRFVHLIFRDLTVLDLVVRGMCGAGLN